MGPCLPQNVRRQKPVVLPVAGVRSSIPLFFCLLTPGSISASTGREARNPYRRSYLIASGNRSIRVEMLVGERPEYPLPRYASPRLDVGHLVRQSRVHRQYIDSDLKSQADRFLLSRAKFRSLASIDLIYLPLLQPYRSRGHPGADLLTSAP